MADLIISIVNYKTKELTAQCLKSIYSKKWKVKFELWVVDNASGDDSPDYIKKLFPRASLIRSEKNLGFAGGHNLVLKKVTSKYILLLNSDTIISPNSLDKMIDFMDKNPSFGISSCKILGFDEKLQPNCGDLPLGLALLSWLFNLEALGVKSSLHRNEKSYYFKSHEVGWVSGNFMLIKKDVLDKIGLLNENFFMYFEDVEFCYRAKKAGFKIGLNADVFIKHLSGGSLDNPHLRQWSGEYRGLIKFYKEQFGFSSAFLLKGLVYIAIIFRIIIFAITGKLNYSLNYAKVFNSI